MNGFFSISRDIMNTWVYNADDPHYFKWWFDLYTSAAYQEKEVMFGRHIVRIHKRQLVASIRQLARRWGAPTKKVHFFLKNLIDSGMIARTVKYNIPIITIIAGYPDGTDFGQSMYGNTIIQNSNISVSNGCVGNGYNEGSFAKHPGEHLGKHTREHPEAQRASQAHKSVSSFKTDDYGNHEEEEKQEEKPENGNNRNTHGNALGNTNSNNINILARKPASARTREEEVDFFAGLLSQNRKFLAATARDFRLDGANDVIPYLEKFRKAENSYAVIDGHDSSTVQDRFRKFQDHFRNWMRKCLRGMYPDFDPEQAERDRRTLVENRKINKQGNNDNNKEREYGIQRNPCKRDTTKIKLAKDISEFTNWDEVYDSDDD